MILFVFLLIFGVINFVASKNIIKDDVNSTSSCCENLYFSSTGPLADSGQNHVLGYYSKLSDGPGDYWNYQQTAGYKRKLWYNPSIKAWFIGDNLGRKKIYILFFTAIVYHHLEIIENIIQIA